MQHDGHGKGTVTKIRKASERYAGAYTPSRYPYIVKFDSGYTDVYAANDLKRG